MKALEGFQVAAREYGFVEVEESEEGCVLWLRKETPDAATKTHQRICIDSRSNTLTVYWMASPGKIDSKIFHDVPSLQKWIVLRPIQMTNREAILRLTVNIGDAQAMNSLRDNNVESFGAAVLQYFGSGPAAIAAENTLMLCLADRARSYDGHEDADEWLARNVNLACDRLRNEGIHDRANSDSGR